MTETPDAQQHPQDGDDAAVPGTPAAETPETGSAPETATAAAQDGTAAGAEVEPEAATDAEEPAAAETPEAAAEAATEAGSAEDPGAEPAEPAEPGSGAEPDAAPASEPTDATQAPVTEAAEASAGDPAADGDPAPDGPVQDPAPAPAPAPAPRPGPRPPLPSAFKPRPRPTAGSAPSPAAAPAVPVPVPDDSAEAAAAAQFGRVDDDGTVYVREGDDERAVGQFPGASADEALALYVRRFLDLQAKVALFEARLTATDLAVKEIDQTLAKLTEETAEPAAVGDLDGLRTRLDGLRAAAAERRAAVEAERAAARQAALEARTAIVERAEKIATTDPARMQWRPAGEQLRGLLDEWKDAQRSGPRIDRTSEEALWKRFSHARTTFDRERRHYFAELESRNAGAKAAKEEIVREAERLASSTDWGATAGAYRDLMARWKASGRASRADDDALWARFRAAQDAFFHARDEVNAATDREFRANLEVKEALLVEAEAIDPAKGLGQAKAALRSIQDRWEAAGKVPRADIQRVEGRLRAVEARVRDADQAEWRRTNPETRARAEGAAAQLENAIAQLEADLAKAQAGGDSRKVAEAQAALDARRSWLEQVQRAAQDSRG
ncbi:DUF349 domain-containing protein [Cellulomonas sp. C5510]|uniref:DUF349 domain-containing protein n=1 Tax=Cellulomonas sp. C5510 TaxID=2871170 RepID=UPI001C95CC68|nr:DUF349 domain-containing protein [Cellulomonas sp. C5510]QZN84278.1 DUF349 domain-containing protein [Cellulomonas sp. C5510]